MNTINHMLDEQVALGLRGDFLGGQVLAAKMKELSPNHPGARFNRGWYEMRAGNLLKGHMLMDAGRTFDVFGNRHTGTQCPILPKGCTRGDILLCLEGGLGDQFHAMRYIKQFNPVSVSCSRELFPIVKEFGVTVCEHTAAHGLDYDYWVPAMSAVSILGHEYNDVSGVPYISKTADTIPDRVGVKWSGNPQFEHEQHRRFPNYLMFDAIQGLNVVSLQRDTDDIPSWMHRPSLETWQDTRREISKCELVITSCTSVAHLAAAMGVQTWIVVPILSYYLWALPGDKTPFYDSVTLFRQEKYGDWAAPFEKIKEKLKCYMHTLKIAA